MRETWWIQPARREALEALVPLRVARWMALAESGQLLSSDRSSAAVRVDAADLSLLVKWRSPRPGRVRRTWLRPSRERKEARAYLAARSRGIPCPEPWAVGERRAWGRLVGSVLVRPYDPGARSGAEWLTADPAALPPLLAAVRHWHDLGFRHGDCYPKNVLVGGQATEPRPIGCPVARFVAPGRALDRRRLKDLGQLAAGVGGDDPRALDCLEAYCKEPGVGTLETLRAAVRPFHERVCRKKAEREASRPLREPDGPPLPVALDPPAHAEGPVRVRSLP